MNSKQKLSYLLAISSVVTAMGVADQAQAQIQIAENLLVDVDATTLPDGTLTSIANGGSLGGVFAARGSVIEVPFVGTVGGTRSMRFDGNDFLQLVAEPGGSIIPAPAGITGADPTRTIEVWALNPRVESEETMVSWGHRGGPDGSNISFNYGSHGAFGAIGHWGSPDIGWNNAGGNPEAGRWHHLVYTYDGTTTRVYSDGVISNTEVLGAGRINTHAGSAINIGAQLEGDGIAVTGGLRARMAIAKVRIHDGVLSDAQVLNNYTVEKPSFIDPSTDGSPLEDVPVHRYSFNDSPAADATGLSFVDSIGAANGTVLGAGARLTGSRLALPGGASTTAAYGDLPNGLLSQNSANNFGSGEFTIEGWVKVTGNRSWSRIFDIGNSAAGEFAGPGGDGAGLDYIFYSAQNGGNVNDHVFVVRNVEPGGTEIGTDIIPSGFNEDLHFAVTWDEAKGEIRIFENGQDVGAVHTGDAMSDIVDVNVLLGRSNWTGDANLQGEYDEVRIYNQVLSPTQVRGNFQAGPDILQTANPVSITADPVGVLINEFGSAVFTVSVEGQWPVSLQWYKNGEPISGATSSVLTLNNVPVSDNNAQITCVASNFVGEPRLATSAAATLQINTDSTPPELLGARLYSLNAIEVIFSEAINAADAMNIDHFTVTGPEGVVALASAQPSSDPSRVILLVSGHLPCGDLLVEVNDVRDASVGLNPIAPGSTAGFFHFIGGGVTHLYNFNNLAGSAASGAVVRDIVGGEDARVLGAGATFTGDKVTLPGGGSATSAYVDLPNQLVSRNGATRGGSGQFTMEGWFRVTGNQNWSRIYDIGSSEGGEITGPGGGGAGLDYLMLSAQIGGDTANRRFELRNEDPAGGGIVTADYATQTFDTDTHFAVTWDEAAGVIKAYENGVPVTSILVDDKMSDLNDVNVWLGRSNWTADNNAQIIYDEVRVYDRVLAETEVANNYTAGPENNFGSLGFLNVGLDDADFTIRVGESIPMLVSADFEFAFDVKLTGSPCVHYRSSNTSVATVDERGIITAVGPGSVEIYASFAGAEEFVPLSVQAVPVSFVTEPVNQTVDEFGTATFVVAVDGSLPIGLQWYKNGAPIPGATSATLNLANVSYSDNNASITCVASNFVDGPVVVTSAAAILTVIPDLVAPELLALRLDTLGSVEVVFSEPVLPADAANKNLYALTGLEGPIAIASAAASPHPARVILTTTGPVPCGTVSVTVNGVRDQSSGANTVAANSSASFYHLIPGGLTHLYNFNNSPGSAPSGSVVRDLIGGENGDVKGFGGQFTGNRVTLPGGSGASAAYVDLPNGLLSRNSANNGGSGEISLEGWVRITGSQNWSRIFDFGSSLVGGVGSEVTGPGGGGEGRDYLMLSAMIGTDVANHRVELRNEDPGGGGIATVDHASVAFNTDSHFVLTWNEATGQITAYENGVQKASMVVDDNMSDINDVNVWLGRSNWTGDANLQGEFDEFRVYDRVLSANDVSNNYNVGLENNYGDLSILDLGASDTMDNGTSQQLVVYGQFELALDVTLTGSPCVDYTSGNTAVLTVNEAGVISAVGAGTTTVTAKVGLISESVTITVLSPNEPPVANNDVYTVAEDGLVEIAALGVLANDTDPDGDGLSAILVSGPSNGSLTLYPDGSFVYIPSSNFNGTDSFSYKANDGLEDSNVAAVTITVVPVNDPPVCSDASATTDEDVPVSITLPASDVDGDALSYAIVTGPPHGSVSLSGGTATYAGNLNYCGTDSFTFQVTDPSGARSGICTVQVTIGGVNDAPTGVIDVSPQSDLGASISGIIVISPNNEGACVTLDGSLSSDVDAGTDCGNGTLSGYLWLVDGNPVGDGVVLETCLEVGTHTVTLLVEDGGGAVGEATATVEVLSASDATEELILLVYDSAIERKNKQPFIATLKTAAAGFERGSFGSGVNRLEAFMNKVDAQVGNDDPAVAAEWKRIAQEIIDALDNPQDCEDCE